MKFRLTFKTPDVLDQLESQFDSKEDVQDAVLFANNFVEYGEYISIEFDTDTKKAKVNEL